MTTFQWAVLHGYPAVFGLVGVVLGYWMRGRR